MAGNEYNIAEIGSKKSFGAGFGNKGIGYMASNQNNDLDMKKKIDIFDQNASVSGYNQVSTWTMT